MTLQQRDKRALAILAAAAVVWSAVWLLTSEGESQPDVVSAFDSVSAAENRLARVRRLAASVPAKQKEMDEVAAELAVREKGIIPAETAAQASAQLVQIIRRITRAQNPAVDVQSTELGQVRPFGDDYGEVLVPVVFTCQIHQLVNLMADLTAQPEIIATSELRVNAQAAANKDKAVQVRLTVSGIVPKSLLPKKKGLGTF